jgi:hypothetical protein
LAHREIGSEFKQRIKLPYTWWNSNKDPRRGMAMFRLDYLSCLLTVLATILVGRKMWTGLVVSGLNSLIVRDRVAHRAVWLYSRECVLHLHKRIQSSGMVEGAETRPASDTDTSSGLFTGVKRMRAFEKAGMQRLSLFRIRREGRHANSISSLAIRELRPFALVFHPGGRGTQAAIAHGNPVP